MNDSKSTQIARQVVNKLFVPVFRTLKFYPEGTESACCQGDNFRVKEGKARFLDRCVVTGAAFGYYKSICKQENWCSKSQFLTEIKSRASSCDFATLTGSSDFEKRLSTQCQIEKVMRKDGVTTVKIGQRKNSNLDNHTRVYCFAFHVPSQELITAKATYYSQITQYVNDGDLIFSDTKMTELGEIMESRGSTACYSAVKRNNPNFAIRNEPEAKRQKLEGTSITPHQVDGQYGHGTITKDEGVGQDEKYYARIEVHSFGKLIINTFAVETEGWLGIEGRVYSGQGITDSVGVKKDKFKYTVQLDRQYLWKLSGKQTLKGFHSTTTLLQFVRGEERPTPVDNNVEDQGSLVPMQIDNDDT